LILLEIDPGARMLERIVLLGSSPSLLGAHGAAQPRESRRGADMNGLRIFLVVSTLTTVVASGCTKQGAQRVTDPVPRPRPGLSDMKEGRWVTGDEELREATARAAKSPIMQRAVQEGATDPRLGLLPSGVVGAIGTTQDGSHVRFTLLPYQYGDDSNHAVYFALLEVNGAARLESFDLIRNRRPGPTEEGFERVNSGEHGLWMRPGPTYVTTSSGVVRRATERFNFARFGACFIPLADHLLGMVHESCHNMGDFPGCTTIGSTAVIAGAALYCAYIAWNG